MLAIQRSINAWLTDHNLNTDDLENNFHVFGINRQRRDRIYISRGLRMSGDLIDFVLEETGIEIIREDVGNPGRDHWIAFRRDFRQASPNLCARIVTLFYLALNNRLTW